MVYETGNETVDDAVRRAHDRTDGLALIAQPADELAAGAFGTLNHTPLTVERGCPVWTLPESELETPGAVRKPATAPQTDGGVTPRCDTTESDGLHTPVWLAG